MSQVYIKLETMVKGVPATVHYECFNWEDDCIDISLRRHSREAGLVIANIEFERELIAKLKAHARKHIPDGGELKLNCPISNLH
ncbi:hypothetical protein [Yersinia ruckeri]|uniref:hypothetical protein n=1 Tax=Yersinia ruckeri TaxID=29486 RepID=UPI002237616A|nr:hypothetical protein [Yersinia ruckeri]MCW6598831.1 hypothetical protein [Yersinia ruckeri]